MLILADFRHVGGKEMLTKGWDTISIVKQDTINSNLEDVWKSENAYFHKLLSDGTSYVEGIFGCFQIINGGGGRIVRMKIPIQSGELVLNENHINLDGISAIIEITLCMLPEQNDLAVLKTEYCNLAKNRDEMTEEKRGWILPVTLIDPEGRIGVYATVVLDSICHYLLENSKQLEMIFAEINFAKNTSPEWVLPKKCAYSYLDSGYLAILSVCDDREISELPLDIDISGISLGTNSFYVLSSELMLKNLILPGLIELYQNADENSYSYKERELYNTHTLRMHEIKSGAIYYTPIVYEKGNVARVDGDYISVTYVGECDMYAGITMYWNGAVKLKASLEYDGTISFYREGTSFSDDEDVPWYLAWLLPIIGLIIQIVVAVISDDLIDSIEKKSGSIKAGNIDSVTWCNRQNITKTAYISESLILEYE